LLRVKRCVSILRGRKCLNAKEALAICICSNIHKSPPYGMGCGAIFMTTTGPPKISKHICNAESPNCSTFGLSHFGEGGQFSSRHRGSVLVRQQSLASLGTLVFRSGALLAATLDEGSLTDAASRGERRSLTLPEAVKRERNSARLLLQAMLLRSSGNDARKRSNDTECNNVIVILL